MFESFIKRRLSNDYGPGTPCSQCGKEMSDEVPMWSEYCVDHISEKVDREMSALSVDSVSGDATPNDELRELVEQWRDEIHMTGFDKEVEARNYVYSKCAEELEELIND